MCLVCGPRVQEWWWALALYKHGTLTLDPSPIQELQRVLGEEHPSLEASQWHLEEIIYQMLLHASQQQYHIWDVLATAKHLLQAQVRVSNIIVSSTGAYWC